MNDISRGTGTETQWPGCPRSIVVNSGFSTEMLTLRMSDLQVRHGAGSVTGFGWPSLSWVSPNTIAEHPKHVRNLTWLEKFWVPSPARLGTRGPGTQPKPAKLPNSSKLKEEFNDTSSNTPPVDRSLVRSFVIFHRGMAKWDLKLGLQNGYLIENRLKPIKAWTDKNPIDPVSFSSLCN